jgi:aspartyl-tRNA(Asn)/glutamyl-tRNA(Gln) amidotransferase subunit B
MIASGHSVQQAVDALGIANVDDSELENLCRSLLEANPKVLSDLKSGRQKAAGALIGQAKKQNPNVNPGRVRELVLRLAEEM